MLPLDLKDLGLYERSSYEVSSWVAAQNRLGLFPQYLAVDTPTIEQRESSQNIVTVKTLHPKGKL